MEQYCNYEFPMFIGSASQFDSFALSMSNGFFFKLIFQIFLKKKNNSYVKKIQQKEIKQGIHIMTKGD